MKRKGEIIAVVLIALAAAGVGAGAHFCPGAAGGTEWNSPAYDPRTNLIFVGDVDWCDTVRVQTKEELQGVDIGQPWFGNRMLNPFDIASKSSRADTNWAGWIHAVDADTGVWKWRIKSDYPIVAAVTPTAGGLVFFGNVGGEFYAVNAETGERLWGRKLGGPLCGSVITYAVNGGQKVAVATGLVSPLWPIPVRTAKIVSWASKTSDAVASSNSRDAGNRDACRQT